jgi:hypothetical protein
MDNLTRVVSYGRRSDFLVSKSDQWRDFWILDLLGPRIGRVASNFQGEIGTPSTNQIMSQTFND